MCGIGIVLDIDKKKTYLYTGLLRDSLVHRGPDGNSIEILETKSNTYLGFAHTRLSILDLSEQGKQPMKDRYSGNVLVFNGEIYNYSEIKDELVARGEVFNSTGDTEVILVGYRVFGFQRLLSKLKGMFAFAIWDEAKQLVKIARDPLGVKPLYFSSYQNRFYLSSEIKALKSSGVIREDISIDSIDSFLSYGSIQPPLTIYKNVYALLPGHTMAIHSDGRLEKQEPYYCLSETAIPNDINIKSALEQSIKRHLVSDVPLGVMLSGGYDSTSIACLSSKYSKESLTSFTMNFPEVNENSELQNAQEISRYLGLDHKIIDIRKQDVFNSLHEYFKAMDQPSDDGLNIYLISKKIREHGIKACLHGAGGDELFGGYPSFKDVPNFMKLNMLPKILRKTASKLIIGNGVIPNKISDLLGGDIDLVSAYLIRRSLFSHDQRKRLLGTPSSLSRKGTTAEWLDSAEKAIKGKTIEKSISTLELLQYSANKLLVDGDVMSMAHGLEIRVPLLDLDLVHSAHSSDEIWDRSNSYSKLDLVNAVDGFPYHLLNKKKQGFTVPVKFWLSEFLEKEKEVAISNLEEKVNLSPLEVHKVFDGFNKHSNKGERWIRSWQLFSLGLWLDHNS